MHNLRQKKHKKTQRALTTCSVVRLNRIKKSEVGQYTQHHITMEQKHDQLPG